MRRTMEWDGDREGVETDGKHRGETLGQLQYKSQGTKTLLLLRPS